MIRAPRNLGGVDAFRTLVDALGQAAAQQVLGVPKRLFGMWYRGTTPAPRCALIALYWESHWGVSVVESSTNAQLQTLDSLSKALMRERDALQLRIAFLQSGHHGCANSSFFDRSSSGVAQLTSTCKVRGRAGWRSSFVQAVDVIRQFERVPGA